MELITELDLALAPSRKHQKPPPRTPYPINYKPSTKEYKANQAKQTNRPYKPASTIGPSFPLPSEARTWRRVPRTCGARNVPRHHVPLPYSEYPLHWIISFCRAWKATERTKLLASSSRPINREPTGVAALNGAAAQSNQDLSSEMNRVSPNSEVPDFEHWMNGTE